MPVNLGEGRQLELLSGFPRPLLGWSSYELCLVIAVNDCSECTDAPMSVNG